MKIVVRCVACNHKLELEADSELPEFEGLTELDIAHLTVFDDTGDFAACPNCGLEDVWVNTVKVDGEVLWHRALNS